MGYDPGLKKLMAKVEASRPDRIAAVKRGEHFRSLTLEERDELLRAFHPDFRDDAKREVRIGRNKGAVYPNELVDVLESRSRLEPARVDLEKVDYDVDLLIVGGGGAGCSAAIAATDAGVENILIATKLRLGDANTMMAEGGIQAADKENDSPVIHYLDVLGGGRFANTPDLVEALVQDAPLVISWLEKMGVMFDKTEDGTMRTLHGGGTSRKRMHSCGDITGAEIMRTLRDEVQCRPQINILEFAPAVEIIKDDAGRAAGAVLYDLDRDQYIVVRAKCTIVSTGGLGRLHLMGFPTTNHYGATADGLAMAYHAGCELVFLESSQFHPTGAIYPEQIIGLLITEKVRGAGAQFLNVDGEQFVYPLETRDVASSALIRECAATDQEGRGKGVPTPSGRFGIWLDSPMIEILRGPGTVRRDFPGKFRMYDNHGIDISREPMLIYPTLHYQNGGVMFNADASSADLENLYFAGEVGGGIHGQNRLMGNSLLDVCVFGRRAGASAAAKVPQVAVGALNLDHVRTWNEGVAEAGLESERSAPLLFPDYRGKVM
ncbi:MAG: FAD-binding protein [Candidatus Zixiibacteriota bacterium]|jgi:succinate dehydrogenase/fumarate reductase flavoprotein subunit